MFDIGTTTLLRDPGGKLSHNLYNINTSIKILITVVLINIIPQTMKIPCRNLVKPGVFDFLLLGSMSTVFAMNNFMLTFL